MRRMLLAVLLLPMSIVFAAEPSASDPFTKGDVSQGAAKAPVCFACHGPGGNGAINAEWPKLAGQHSSYVYEQLNEFKGHQRAAAVMMGQASALSDDDMRNLAAYFAAQPPVPGVGSKDAIPVAEKIYRAGDASRGLPACAACHGPTGAGNAAAQFPRISGQNAGYVVNQLHNYVNGARAQGKAEMMKAVASRLSEPEMQALGSYVAGLH